MDSFDLGPPQNGLSLLLLQTFVVENCSRVGYFFRGSRASERESCDVSSSHGVSRLPSGPEEGTL